MAQLERTAMPGPVTVNGTGGSDALVVNATSADDGTYTLNGVTTAFTDATSFTFNGLGGDDSFTIVNPGGGLFVPPSGVSYDGGGQAGDTLAILGGSAPIGANYFSGTSTSGVMAHDAPTNDITFNNVGSAPITDTVTENFLSFSALTSGTDTVTISDGAQVGGQNTTVVDGASFVGVRFANKTILDLGTFQFPGTDRLNFDNPTPAAGLSRVVAQSFGRVTQTAALNYDDVILHGIAGPVELDTHNNDVDFLAAALTGAGQAFSFRDVDDLILQDSGNADGITTSNGAITVTTVNGAIGVSNAPQAADVSAGTATVALTAGSTAGSDAGVTLDAGANVTGQGGVTLTADNITLGIFGVTVATVNAGTAVATFQPFEAGTLINVGGADGANTLGLSDAELDHVTAGVVRVGNAASGDLTVSTAITQAGAGYGALSLRSAGLISETTGSLAVSNLAVRGNRVDLQNAGNAVGTLAGLADGGLTAFRFQQNGALTVGDVDGFSGVAASFGSLEISANDTITLAATTAAESIRSGSQFGAGLSLTATGATSDIVATTNTGALTAPGGDIIARAGRDILLGTAGAGFDNDVRARGLVSLQAGRDVTVAGGANVASDATGDATGGTMVVVAARDVNIGAGGSLGNAGNGGGFTIVQTGADGFLNLTASSASALFSTSGRVLVDADNVVIAAGSGISADGAAGVVEIGPRSSGWSIDLGAAADSAANTFLELSDAELDRIATPILRIGNRNLPTVVNVTGQITATTYQTLALSSNGAMIDLTTGEQSDLTVASLALRAAAGIGVADDLDTAVATLAFSNTNGNVNISNAGALTIGAVDGLASSSNSGGTTTIRAASPLTFAANVTTAGTTSYEAGETADGPTGADDLTINGGIKVEVTAGDLTLMAGDDIILETGAQAIASGNVFLLAGNGDADNLGRIESRGLIQGLNVTIVGAFGGILAGRVVAITRATLNEPNGAILDSNTSGADVTAFNVGLIGDSGVGTSADPLEIDADDLEARATTGGIFLRNTGDVRIGDVDGGLQGLSVVTSGNIDFVTAGSITLADSNAAQVVKGGSTSGNVALTADGAAADVTATVNNQAVVAPGGAITVTAGRDIVLGTGGANFNNDVRADGSVLLIAGRDVTLGGAAEVVSDSFAHTTNAGASVSAERDITIADNATVGAIGAGDAALATGADGLLSLNGLSSNTVFSNFGFVRVAADRVAIAATSGVTAGNFAQIGPRSVNRAIDLGSPTDVAPNTLELSDAELDRIFAAHLEIGHGSAGPLTVSASISPANVTGSLFLRSGADVTVNAGVTVTSALNLELSAGDSFTLAAGATLQAGAGITVFLDDDDDPGFGGTADLRNGTLVPGAGSVILLFGNSDDDTFFGSAADERLLGEAGNDLLDGGGGSDRLTGGAGNDTYVLDRPGDVIVETAGQGIDTVRAPFTFTLTNPHLENLTLLGTGNFRGTGNAAANVIVGNAGANILTGNAGNDTLDGRGGIDRLVGGVGNDAYVIDRSSDVVVESARQGIDTVRAPFTFALANPNLENLTLLGAGNFRGTGNAAANVLVGNAGANVLTGNAGNDRLDGQGGSDRLVGGVGNDTYVLDRASDVIVEGARQGIDTVRAGFGFALTNPNLENLTLLGAGNVVGAGNNAANVVTGNAGVNTLRGLAGNDRLLGLNGNDVMDGNAGNDFLDGGLGNDRLTGGLGRDSLVGGAGADLFDFNAAADSRRGAALRDTVSFRRADGDKIDLSTIDADSDGTGGNQAFRFIGAQAFHGVDGELRFAGGLLQGDTNGDRIADIEIRIVGALTRDDVIL
jgi:Ca2+-binding RTX toxin-like protein